MLEQDAHSHIFQSEVTDDSYANSVKSVVVVSQTMCQYFLVSQTLRLFSQILWTFSIYLESVAILPQLFMISKTGEAETITTHYLFFLGLYRALYLINWIWRFYFEGFFDMIAIVAGVVQTILYCDFFYLYVTKGESCCVFFSFFIFI